MIIDFHTHIFPDKIANKTISYLMEKGGIPSFSDGKASGLLEKMEIAGVDISVALPAMTNPTQFDSINRYAMEINEQYKNSKKRIISFGGIHPSCDDIESKMRFIKESGFLGIKIHPDYQGVEYCNLARTYVEGGNYGVDFNHWRGSGNVKDIKFAPNAEIHVDTELIMHQWSGGGVVAAIKTAWKNGATVIVHNTFDYDTFVTVEAYSVNPNALNKTCGEGCCPPDEF